MRAVKLAVCVALLAMFSGPVEPRAATPPTKAAPAKKTLSSSYVVTAGDMIALNASNLLNALKAIDAPLAVRYESKDKKLDVGIFGGRSTVDGPTGAKAEIEAFLAVGTPVLAHVAQQYDIELTDAQLRVFYYDRSEGLKLVVKRENGVYVLE